MEYRKSKFKFVKIDWLDSRSCSGWQSVDDPSTDEDLAIESYGWLVNDTKISKSISNHRDSSDKFNHVMDIPACAIKRIRILKETK